MMAMREVGDEQIRQIEKWGEQNHTPAMWLAILTEEIGEVAQAVCKAWVPPYDTLEQQEWLGRYRAELVQVAAVAISAIESFDRNERITA
jgi:NTP pyrophosphatase (non-canonical NTP hydrolase)